MILLLLIFASALAAYATLRRAGSLGSPLSLVTFFMVVQLVLRPAILAVGLDVLYLPASGSLASYEWLLEQTQILVLVWMTIIAFASRLRLTNNRPANGTFSRSAIARWVPSDHVARRSVILLLFVSLAGTTPRVVQYGGVFEFAAARKLQHVDVNFLFRSPAVWAAIISLLVADSYRVQSRFGLALTYLLLYLSGALISLAWGARDGFIFPLIAVLSSHMLKYRVRHISLGKMVRPAVAIILVVSVAYQLRIWRDIQTTGGVAATLADETAIRRLSVGTNGTMFDALAVARWHWPAAEPFVGFDDFVNSSSLLSEALTAARVEQYVPVNVRIAQVSAPSRINGTPSTAIGDWYIAFGPVGVAAGAAVSAIVLLAMERWHTRIRGAVPLFATTFTTVTIFGVLTGGVTSMSLQRAPVMLAPSVVLIIIQLARRGRQFARGLPSGQRPLGVPGAT